MSKIKEPDFIWNDKAGVAVYTAYDHLGRAFNGVATCADEDLDMKSQKVGYEIACKRAGIALVKQHIKDLKGTRKDFKELLDTYQLNPQYNKDDFYARILRKRIYSIDLDIETFKSYINTAKEDLASYIRIKDGFYKKVREARAKSAAAHEHPEE